MSEGIITRRIKTPTPFLLDKFRNAAAAYSLRALTSSGQDNAVVKVRRDSDNAEQDFSPAEINDGSLLTFVGNTASDNGFVTTWYDQSGNGNHATQATAASQPKIVSAGSLVVENGKPAIDFDGSDDYLDAALSETYTQPNTIFNVATQFVVSGYFYDSLTSSPRTLLITNNKALETSAGNQLKKDDFFTLGQQYLITVLYDSVNSNIHVDGSLELSGDAGTSSTDSFKFATRSNEVFWGEVKYQELIFYPSDQSSSRQQIESNINTHYGIY